MCLNVCVIFDTKEFIELYDFLIHKPAAFSALKSLTQAMRDFICLNIGHLLNGMTRKNNKFCHCL